MLCPVCETAAIITSARTVTVNDDTPDLPTEVYTVQEFYCRNRKCPRCATKVGECRHRLV